MKKRYLIWTVIAVLTIILCACSMEESKKTTEETFVPEKVSQNTDTGSVVQTDTEPRTSSFEPSETTVSENDFSFWNYKNGVEVKAEGVLSGKIVVPEEYEGKPVIRVANNGFKGQKEILELILPASLKSIGNNAFSGCEKLIKLKIPDGVDSLGAGAFSHMAVLKELVLPGGAKVIADHVIEDCAIEKLIFPEGVEELQTECVTDCPDLHVIGLPSTIKKIKATFNNCPVDTLEIADLSSYCMCEGYMQWDIKRLVMNGEIIADLVLPEGLERITFMNAFQAMDLRSVVLPESLTYIGDSAFSLTGIDHVDFPENLKEIGRVAFYGCPIKEVCFPESLRYIRDSAFENTLLEKAELPEGIHTIAHAAFSGTMIEEIILPEGVVELGEEAFFGCPLKKAVLPHSLKKIGKGSFASTLLEEIVLPDGIVEIGQEAFKGSPLKKVDYPDSLRTIGDFAFADTLLEKAILPEGIERIGREAFATDTMKEIELPLTLREFYPFQTAPNLEKMVYRGTEEDLRLVDMCFFKVVLKEVNGMWVNVEVIEHLSVDDPMPDYFVLANKKDNA